jgi:hypothetical protein
MCLRVSTRCWLLLPPNIHMSLQNSRLIPSASFNNQAPLHIPSLKCSGYCPGALACCRPLALQTANMPWQRHVNGNAGHTPDQMCKTPPTRPRVHLACLAVVVAGCCCCSGLHCLLDLPDGGQLGSRQLQQRSVALGLQTAQPQVSHNSTTTGQSQHNTKAPER